MFCFFFIFYLVCLCCAVCLFCCRKGVLYIHTHMIDDEGMVPNLPPQLSFSFYLDLWNTTGMSSSRAPYSNSDTNVIDLLGDDEVDGKSFSPPRVLTTLLS